MVGSDCIAQRLIMLLLLCEGDECVLDVLQGGQYGLLIRDEGLVAEGLLTVDVGNNGTALEDGPCRRRVNEERTVIAL